MKECPRHIRILPCLLAPVRTRHIARLHFTLHLAPRQVFHSNYVLIGRLCNLERVQRFLSGAESLQACSDDLYIVRVLSKVPTIDMASGLWNRAGETTSHPEDTGRR